jgi:hypothetical protein
MIIYRKCLRVSNSLCHRGLRSEERMQNFTWPAATRTFSGRAAESAKETVVCGCIFLALLASLAQVVLVPGDAPNGEVLPENDAR